MGPRCNFVVHLNGESNYANIATVLNLCHKGPVMPIFPNLYKYFVLRHRVKNLAEAKRDYIMGCFLFCTIDDFCQGQ